MIVQHSLKSLNDYHQLFIGTMDEIMLRNIRSGNNIGSSMTFTFLGQDSTWNYLIWSFHQNESERKERLRKIQNSTKEVAVIQKVIFEEEP